MKKKTTSQLKKELDKYFSLYIRQKFSNKNGTVNCYTCGALKQSYKEIQCGHFVSRQYLAARFEESNCRPQCVGCNIWGKGKPLDFEEKLKKELGDDVVEYLKKKRHEITKDFPYAELIAKYKLLTKV